MSLSEEILNYNPTCPEKGELYLMFETWGTQVEELENEAHAWKQEALHEEGIARDAQDEVQRLQEEIREWDRVAKQEFRYLTKVKKELKNMCTANNQAHKELEKYAPIIKENATLRKHAEKATKIGIEGRRLGIKAGIEKVIKLLEDSPLSYGETFRVLRLLKEELE